MDEGPGSERAWVVGPARLEATGDELRIDIDGEDVFVRAPGHALADMAEAWATLLAIPAARTSTPVVLDRSVDAAWLAGAQANVAAMASWWGGDDHLELRTPSAAPARRWTRGLRRTPKGERSDPAPASGRALCFTAGVDSFFSLLACDHQPTHLLFVHGYDLALDDTDRRAGASAAIREVAATLGLVPIEVETNLRHHHCFAQASWEHTHGAALVCVAMLLRAELGAVIIPPSYSNDRLIPWGSRPDLDPRWSVPGVLAVEHGDARSHRRERLQAVAPHPLVHRHLRVCWAHLADGLNCGRCEKCVRTMVDLAAVGQLEQVQTFPRHDDLAAVIDAMETPPATLAPLWRDLRELPLEPEVCGALDRVLARMEAGRPSG